MDRQQRAFVETFAKEIGNENAAVFAGAGLSVPAGFVNWKQLLKGVADEIGLDVEIEHDLVAIAQYHFNDHQNRAALNRVLIEQFSPGNEVTESHRILARLPIKTFWTTNYDDLIERALKESGRLPDVKHTISQLKHTLPRRDAIVYKMHGDASHPNEAVLIKDDYEQYPETHGRFATALSGDLIEKCFLFLGFSFSDPNLEYILSRVRLSLHRQPRDHYCLFKRMSRGDYDSEEGFSYAVVKQELIVRDLKRFGVQAVLVDRYDEVPKLLRILEDRYKRRTVLISGSAHDYGRHGEAASRLFVSSLTEALLRNSNRIVSGFGLGIGGLVISGALEEIYQRQHRRLHDELILRPFPQGVNAETQWEAYRRDMVQYAGIAIFIFGNKFENGTVIPALGVRREFEMARESGLSVIPVGASGFVAEELWKEVLADFDRFYPDRPDIRGVFEGLGPTEELAETVPRVLKIIELLKRS